jgi:hypothetical protein
MARTNVEALMAQLATQLAQLREEHGILRG